MLCRYPWNGGTQHSWFQQHGICWGHI
jgi:hypothetical protein